MKAVAAVLAAQLLLAALGWGIWHAYHEGHAAGHAEGRQLQFQIMDRALFLACEQGTPLKINGEMYACRRESST